MVTHDSTISNLEMGKLITLRISEIGLFELTLTVAEDSSHRNIFTLVSDFLSP